jgi:hypothetical protein
MILAKWGFVVALACSGIWLGCDGDTVVDKPGSGGNGASGGSGGAVGGGGSGGSGGVGGDPFVPVDGYVYAFDTLLLGDTDRNGSPSPNAWRQYGFNLDGLVSDVGANDLCQPAAGGTPSSVYPDGDGGIDNAFGKLIMPIITGLSQDASGQVNDAIDQGLFTYLLWIEELGTSADQDMLTLRSYEAAPLGALPAFDGNDAWKVTHASLIDGSDIHSAKGQFGSTAVVAHALSASAGTFGFALSFGAGAPMVLELKQAQIAVTLTPDRTRATGGVIGGIIETEAFIDELRKAAGAIDQALCSGTTFDSLADQIRQASDILVDGTQDPNATCNAMSIGLGFESVQADLAGIAAALPPPVDPCAP